VKAFSASSALGGIGARNTSNKNNQGFTKIIAGTNSSFARWARNSARIALLPEHRVQARFML
jgi:hypothetical protein